MEQVKRQQIKELFEKDKEIDRLKLLMYINISHEFRTPLTLILSPLENMINRIKEPSIRDDIKLIHRNAKRLLTLVNQLLDLRQLETDKYPVKPSVVNIEHLSKEVFLSFKLLAQKKEIDFTFNSAVANFEIISDADIVEKVLFNLISNAFKHTSVRGSICLSLEKTDDYVYFIVSDTGTGISLDDLPYIFDRFFSTKNSKNHLTKYNSSGIGLSLTRDLVRLLSGEIDVKTIEGQGCEFTVKLPLDKFGEVEIVTQDYLSDQDMHSNEKFFIEEQIVSEGDSPVCDLVDDIPSEDDEKATILVVEDNLDMRNFLHGILKENYQVIRAANGEEGFSKAITFMPDLVLSDIMMPLMDGLSFCSSLKNDIRINHIPVILLTARQGADLQIEGLEKGADAYLNKPFSQNMVEVQIQNLLDNRERLRKFYSQNMDVDNFSIESNNPDKEFLTRALKIINENLGNTEFNVDDFAAGMGMGRSSFYKKVKMVCGQTANDLIRTIRLKKAAHLIKTTNKSISEIYFEAGFNDGSYFAQCFFKEFGCLPSNYKNT